MNKHAEMAKALHDALITSTRSNGVEFIRLADGSPQWMTEIIHQAHRDMMPDDTRYSMIKECLSEMCAIDPELWNNSSNDIACNLQAVTNHELAAWLASHNLRFGYCDEALPMGLLHELSTMFDRLQAGQYVEYIEIAEALITAIDARAEEDASDERGE